MDVRPMIRQGHARPQGVTGPLNTLDRPAAGGYNGSAGPWGLSTPCEPHVTRGARRGSDMRWPTSEGASAGRTARRSAVPALLFSAIALFGCGGRAPELDADRREERLEAVRQLPDSAGGAGRAAEAARHEDVATAREAVRRLGRMSAPAAREALRRLASDEARSPVREEAIVMLARHRDAALGTLFVERLGADPAPAVRAAAAAAIGRADYWDGLDALIAALEDEDAAVRRAANAGLWRLCRLDFGFRPEATPQERAQVVARLRAIRDDLAQIPNARRAPPVLESRP